MPDIHKINSLNIGSNVDIEEALRLVSVNLSQIVGSLNLSINSLSRHDQSGKGPVQSTFDPRFTLQPNFNTELGITAGVTGLDGTSLYVYSKPDFVIIDPLFRKANEFGESRPRSIYETFVAFKSYLDNRINNLDIVIENPGTNCIDNCSYTKEYIGLEAFDPTLSSSPGSIDYNVRLALHRINQLATSIFGPGFPLAPGLSSPFPPIGLNGCTLARRVNALLQLHNGSAWSLNAFGATCDIELSHDGTGGGGDGPAGGPQCIPRYTDFFPTNNADSYFILNDGTKTPINHSVFSIDDLEGSTYGVLSSLLEDPDPAGSSVSIKTSLGLPLWQFSIEDNGFGPEGYGTIICNRWTWNLNGAYRKNKTNEGAFGEIEEEKSKLTLDTPIDLSFIYEWEKSEFASGDTLEEVPLDNASQLLQHRFELTLFGKVLGEDTAVPVAKKTGSLGNLNNLGPWDFQEDPEPGHATILPGSNKIVALKGITLAEFDWLAPLDPDDLRVLEGLTDISTLLSHAQVVVYHKPGTWSSGVATAIAGEEGPDGATEIEEILGKLKFIGCEIQYLDDICKSEEGDEDCFYSDEEGNAYIDENGFPYIPEECDPDPDPGPDPDPEEPILEEDFEDWGDPEEWPFIEPFEDNDWTEEPDAPETLTGPFVEDFEGGDW